MKVSYRDRKTGTRNRISEEAPSDTIRSPYQPPRLIHLGIITPALLGSGPPPPPGAPNSYDGHGHGGPPWR